MKVFGKRVGFTVRQVIEGPGKVADIFLKPLEKLADAALKPVLHALHLEVRTPRELVAIEHSLDAVGDHMTALTRSTARSGSRRCKAAACPISAMRWTT